MLFLIIGSIAGYLAIMITIARVHFALSPPTERVCVRDSDRSCEYHRCQMESRTLPRREGATELLKLWAAWPVIIVCGGIGWACYGTVKGIAWTWRRVIMRSLVYGVSGHPVRQYREYKTDKVMIKNPVTPRARRLEQGTVSDHDNVDNVHAGFDSSDPAR